MHHNF